jgi:hypothetical protein
MMKHGTVPSPYLRSWSLSAANHSRAFDTASAVWCAQRVTITLLSVGMHSHRSLTRILHSFSRETVPSTCAWVNPLTGDWKIRRQRHRPDHFCAFAPRRCFGSLDLAFLLRSDSCTFHSLFRRIVLLRLIRSKSCKAIQVDCGLLNGASSAVVSLVGSFLPLTLL